MKQTGNSVIRFIAFFVIAALLFATFPAASFAEPAEPKVTIGIAWRKDLDSEFLNNLCNALLVIGAEPVILEKVIDNDLVYTEGELSEPSLDADGHLTDAAADLIKKNTCGNSNAAQVLENVDAVIFTGGVDISPNLYKDPEDWEYIESDEPDRDVSDYLLMSYCIDNDIPLIGICRGMQMLTVVSGGSMILDIPKFYSDNGLEYHYEHRNEKTSPDAYRDYAPHDVELKNGTLTADLFEAEKIIGAPSWHHQAALSVEGTNLEVTGETEVSGYRMIEAVERADKSFIVGLQFHPEAAIIKHLTNAENADLFMNLEDAYKPLEKLVAYCLRQKPNKAA